MWLPGTIPGKTFAQRHGKTHNEVKYELRATKEHIIPRSHGGGSDLNIVAAHSKCNNERGNQRYLKKPLPHVAIHLPLEVQHFISDALRKEPRKRQ